jgi:bis(5'-nucleosyl)-tetraphosphatase (symmetrical)
VADYAIGDVQGCYNPLQRLLELIDFDDRRDRLWFVGDLVNRGPQSLDVMRWVKRLPLKPYVTLGNHDLHLLSLMYAPIKRTNDDDTLQAILAAPDRDELGDWLRHQSILVHDESLQVVMCHAGIAPHFTLDKAKTCARELEAVLSGDLFSDFLAHMYGNEPNTWYDQLQGNERLRYICNAFTRMRFCDENSRLQLAYKGTVEMAPLGLYPWFAAPHRVNIDADIIFGHWAALLGQCLIPRIHALDTGCFWGGALTALRLQDKQRFTFTCKS